MQKTLALISLLLAVLCLFPSCSSKTQEVETIESQSFLAELQNKVGETDANEDAEDLSETVYVTASGERYHKKNCRHIKKSKTVTTVSVSEAKKDGYTACKTCYK